MKSTNVWKLGLLDVTALKEWLPRDLKSCDKLLLVLGTFDRPRSIADLREQAAQAGFKLPKKWNPSLILGRSKGLAIKVPTGWELTNAGKSHLRNLGVSTLSPAAVAVASDLRKHLANIKNSTTSAFVEEAIKCHEAELYRSAIVMSWIAAVDVLYKEIVANHLSAFNTAARKVDSRWKAATDEDGLSRMKEAVFLDRLAAIGVLGKNTKEELAKALKLRNGCGHPNSLKVGPNMVASHLEALILNVFKVFAY
jgi:hypothetical protein